MTDCLDLLAEQPFVQVAQKREWGEILTGWETRNRYEVRDSEGQPMLMAGEMPGSFVWILLRQWVASRRPFTIEVRDLEGNLVLTVQRRWRWILDQASIFDGEGRLLGSLQQHFTIFKRSFSILDAEGQTIAEVQGPFWRPWTFNILVNGHEAGAIRKKWSGILKESFTDADNFGIEFGGDMHPILRAICLGATFLIDFAYFESSK